MKIIFPLLLAIPVLSGWYSYGTKDEVDCSLKKTERIVSGSGEQTRSKYLVFCETETFENTDSFFYLKFSSSDIYGKLEPGQQYSLRVYGWRIPFLSMYRNIIEVQQ